jgi:hypothetical protein
MIFFELLVDRPAFPESLHPYRIAFRVAESERPEISDSVPSPTRALIEDFWAPDRDDPPTDV